jgi:hypothetical protein
MCDQATLKNQLSTKASCPIDFGTAIVFLLLAPDPKTIPVPDRLTGAVLLILSGHLGSWVGTPAPSPASLFYKYSGCGNDLPILAQFPTIWELAACNPSRLMARKVAKRAWAKAVASTATIMPARMVARTARVVTSGHVHLVGFRVSPWLDNFACSWPWQRKNTMGAVSIHILKIDGTHDLCLVAFDR